jgi:hypothetical protein
MPSFSTRGGGADCPAPSNPANDDLQTTAPPAIVLMNVRRSCGFLLMGVSPSISNLAERSATVKAKFYKKLESGNEKKGQCVCSYVDRIRAF